jgi:hypothetical protein
MKSVIFDQSINMPAIYYPNGNAMGSEVLGYN